MLCSIPVTEDIKNLSKQPDVPRAPSPTKIRQSIYADIWHAEKREEKYARRSWFESESSTIGDQLGVKGKKSGLGRRYLPEKINTVSLACEGLARKIGCMGWSPTTI
jgi:hypothetical protein